MIEIERKFLVANDSWKQDILSSHKISQFYLSDLSTTPTVRIRQKDDKGFLTLKYPSKQEDVLVRAEFEYEIPVSDVTAHKQFAKGRIVEKTRHLVRGAENLIWEIDVFSSPNPDLVLAEIELKTADQIIQLPDWIGPEVTHNPSYSNIRMAFQSV
ncbi:CYTH domain-containing protein [Sneathiella limimaris]|uniref:CYTH domain-containing protein n=1 Tax=Sneathiella limimaris TaxID=1964213 RepID=UPI00146DCA4E|nr:CYTH domain-containing protein [Sneathiella limimaris]